MIGPTIRVSCYGRTLSAFRRADGVITYDVGTCPVSVAQHDNVVALLSADGLDAESARNLTLMADACLAILEPVA